MRLLIVISILSFILLVVLMVFSGNRQAYAIDDDKLLLLQNAQVSVDIITMQNSFTKPRSIFGQIESTQQSDIGFELSGILSDIAVVEGAVVERGSILASLDVSRLQARKNELLSALGSAKAGAKLAKLSAQRVAELVQAKLEPQQRLDEVAAQLDAADAAVSEAKARLNSIQVELAKSVLTAPFSGQVVKRFVDKGTVLKAGDAVFSILAGDGLEAHFGLPEQTAFGLTVGQQINLKVANVDIPARVKSIAKERQLATRTIEAVFDIDTKALSEQQGKMLVSGDLVSFRVDIPVEKSGAWVPISALASGVRGMWTLYVVNKKDQIETRIVSIEYAEQHRAFVTGAITNGDKLVINGIHRLTPHQRVNNVQQASTLPSSTLNKD